MYHINSNLHRLEFFCHSRAIPIVFWCENVGFYSEFLLLWVDRKKEVEKKGGTFTHCIITWDTFLDFFWINISKSTESLCKIASVKFVRLAVKYTNYETFTKVRYSFCGVSCMSVDEDSKTFGICLHTSNSYIWIL